MAERLFCIYNEQGCGALKKITVIFILKSRTILYLKSPLVGSLFSIGTALLTQSLGLLEETHVTYPFVMEIVFNTLITSCLASAFLLAVEKEKRTLRVITSCVSGPEFLIGSLLPVFLLAELSNILLLMINSTGTINIPLFLLVTSAAVLLAVLFGAAVGLMANTLISAGMTLVLPMVFLLILTMYGTYSEMGLLRLMSGLTFTGAMTQIVIDLMMGGPSMYGVFQYIILFCLWFAVAGICFAMAFRRKRELYGSAI